MQNFFWIGLFFCPPAAKVLPKYRNFEKMAKNK